MDTLGQQLKTARERKKIGTSEAARKTRIKIQHIEAMERDDFSRIPAPAYAKGFIKIYAEYLGLDPEPLIAEYLERYAPRERPPLVEEEPSEEPRKSWNIPKIPWKEIVIRLREVLSAINWSAFKQWPWPRVPPRLVVMYLVIAAFFLVVLAAVTRWAGREKADAEAFPERPVPAMEEQEYPVIRDVPDPYLDEWP